MTRCQRIAEPNKETCIKHGATHILTKENADKCKAASIKNGFNITEILMCTKTCVIAQSCQYYQQLVDSDRYGSTIPRCLPEQLTYDAITERFREEYELDDVADQVMLNRLGMNLVRLWRGEKIIATTGELVERIKTSPDGSYETWMEESAISRSIDSLDRRVQAWLKELAVSKAAREGKHVQVTGNINLTNLLSDPANATIIDADQLIDADFDE